jgi:uncharacterized protein YbjT (DUF2867 family)
MTYLVTGATGNVGGELATQLLEQGHEVRALVRDASRAGRLPAGTGIAVGDLDDAGSLTAAARGADGVFYMQVAPLPAQAQYMVAAAKAAGVSKIRTSPSSLGSAGAILSWWQGTHGSNRSSVRSRCNGAADAQACGEQDVG